MTSRLNLTDGDRKILRHVEEFGSITITQCQNMFYNTQGKGYEISRRHLSKLVQYQKLNVFKESYCNKNVYHDGKKPSYHRILLMDYYSMLVKYNAFINHFSKEKKWMVDNEKYFSDGFCVYTINGQTFFDVIEVVRTKSVDPKKYIELYDSREIHDFSNEIYRELGGTDKRDVFPRIVVIDDVVHKNPLFINDKVEVVQLDFKFSNFSDLII